VIHALAPASEYDPAGQLTHALVPASEYEPAEQLTHALVPASEYDPAGHVWQVAAAVAADEAEYVPTPHDVHPTLPVAILYVPAAHGEQTPPSGPVYPTLQVQSATASLELGELELPGHVTQVALPVVIL